MASLHRRPHTKNWFCAYYLPDGRRAFRSTGTSNRRKALAVAVKYDEASRLAKSDHLNESVARRVINDIYALKRGEQLPSDTVREYLESWLQRKAGEIAESSYAEYKMTADLILQHLGQLADKPMDAVERRDAMSFRDALVKRVSPATANKRIKIARVIWGAARRDGVVQDNPFTKVEGLKVERSQRRPFTMQELKTVLAACDTEWKGIVLVGLYTGQRLGDITNLRWGQIDFEQKTVSFVTQKTEHSSLLPLHKVLCDFLLTLPSADDPSDAVFPAAVTKGTNTLSREFGEILHKAGLIVMDKPQRMHEGQGKGRNARRAVGGLSFHCLRHTATSLLKNAGASDVVAREIIGHDSEAVSRRYTHIETDTLRTAVDKMPDVTS